MVNYLYIDCKGSLKILTTKVHFVWLCHHVGYRYASIVNYRHVKHKMPMIKFGWTWWSC